MQINLFKESLKSFALISALCLVLCSCENSTGSKLSTTSRSPEAMRVACVGDSITFGAWLEDREKNSYPAQLAVLLGDGWQVRNFGVNNATALKKGNYPYWNTQAFSDALAFRPQVVIINLGTNDARPHNWKYKDDYVRDYIALIKSFQALESKPAIWLCNLAPARTGKRGGFYKVIQEEVIPRITEVSRRTGLPVIDLNSALSNGKELFADALHPNERGAKVMAEIIYLALTRHKPVQPSPARSSTPVPISRHRNALNKQSLPS